MPPGSYIRTPAILKKQSEAQLGHAPTISGPDHPWWRGDNVGYHGIHHRARKKFPKPDCCTICKKEGKLQIHNITGKYDLNLPSDWVWVCASCHQDIDGRKENHRERMQILNKNPLPRRNGRFVSRVEG